MTRLPDFIVIGAMKCATSTLHEQLARQCGVFMCTPKEPNFFSDSAQFQRGLSWYSALFEHAPADSLCGESSTHYTKRPTYPDTVDRIAAVLGGSVRFVYIMRHPIERLVSQYIHEWTQRRISVPIEDALDRYPELIEYSRYAMQLQPYFDAFGPDHVLPVFLERLRTDPQSELERICRFVGYTGEPRWDLDMATQNVSSERLRSNPLRDAVADFPPLRALRRAMIPQSVRNRIKSRWTMGARPELSADDRSRLAEIFDAEFDQLTDWTGLPLTCQHYDALVGEFRRPDDNAPVEHVA